MFYKDRDRSAVADQQLTGVGHNKQKKKLELTQDVAKYGF